MKTQLFTGTGVALVTPFTEDDVDLPLMGELIDRQLAAGTDCLVVLGTTGEPTTMTERECDAVIEYTVRRVDGRVPVVVGAGDNDTRRALEKCRRRTESGADGLLTVTPYYNKATQDGMVRHFEMLADAARVPLILYNVPSRTGVNLLPETVKRLAAHENICGFKEASPSIVQLSEAVRLCEGQLSVYAGNDDLALPAMAVGARGVISVIGNAWPEQVVRMTDCFFRGELEAARAAYQEMAVLTRLLFQEVSPIPIKAALRLMGYGDGRLRMPLTDISKDNEDELLLELQRLGLVRGR
ncbi:4-hydroxy-tetrahydrodipicolinate synthase [Bacillota bacterium Meth-B3]|nr:4-hydroxy-tetrahydrodipicolinate synthase [Christensenellaceae bacterium]